VIECPSLKESFFKQTRARPPSLAAFSFFLYKIHSNNFTILFQVNSNLTQEIEGRYLLETHYCGFSFRRMGVHVQSVWV
jgi:hypothetical protein